MKHSIISIVKPSQDVGEDNSSWLQGDLSVEGAQHHAAAVSHMSNIKQALLTDDQPP
jgi:hypothetical protein